jgi:hypothetical protein
MKSIKSEGLGDSSSNNYIINRKEDWSDEKAPWN